MTRRQIWMRALAAWAAFVLLFSTRTEIRGEPFVWVSVSWLEALQISFAQWSTWGVLTLLIIWIDRRLPVRRDALVQRFLWHIPLSFVFTVTFVYGFHATLVLLGAPNDPSLLAGGPLATLWRVIHRNTTFVYWVIVGILTALDYQRHLKDRQIKNAELERLLSDARMQTLRTQLHPHFLFNALNAASAYVQSNPQLSRVMIEQLGDLLRLSLEHTSEQEIPLAQEFAFVERYLQLQAVRFEDRLAVSLTPAPDVLDALVPPFILQPLVENAIRHGTSPHTHAGSIAVDARRENGHVRLSVRDNGSGLPAGWTLESSAGIGLSNTRERLRHLYGEHDQSLVIGPAPGGGVRVELTVPFHSA